MGDAPRRRRRARATRAAERAASVVPVVKNVVFVLELVVLLVVWVRVLLGRMLMVLLLEKRIPVGLRMGKRIQMRRMVRRMRLMMLMVLVLLMPVPIRRRRVLALAVTLAPLEEMRHRRQICLKALSAPQVARALRMVQALERRARVVLLLVGVRMHVWEGGAVLRVGVWVLVAEEGEGVGGA